MSIHLDSFFSSKIHWYMSQREAQPPTSAPSRHHTIFTDRYRAPVHSSFQPIKFPIFAADRPKSALPLELSPSDIAGAAKYKSATLAIQDRPLIPLNTKCLLLRQNRGPCTTRSSLTTSLTSKKMELALSISVRHNYFFDARSQCGLTQDSCNRSSPCSRGDLPSGL